MRDHEVHTRRLKAVLLGFFWGLSLVLGAEPAKAQQAVTDSARTDVQRVVRLAAAPGQAMDGIHFLHATDGWIRLPFSAIYRQGDDITVVGHGFSDHISFVNPAAASGDARTDVRFRIPPGWRAFSLLENSEPRPSLFCGGLEPSPSDEEHPSATGSHARGALSPASWHELIVEGHPRDGDEWTLCLRHGDETAWTCVCSGLRFGHAP